tara:strand:+ start:1725 stop:1979 length:255 start_codon:yes stop_codon:yes gene_type:complete
MPSKKEKRSLKIFLLKKQWDNLLRENQIQKYALMRRIAAYRNGMPRKTEMNFRDEDWYKEGRCISAKATQEIMKIKEQIKSYKH